MGKYSIENYINLKREIEILEATKKELKIKEEELQKDKNILELNYINIEEHKNQIKIINMLQGYLKFHQFAEKRNLKSKLKEHYGHIENIDSNVKNKFGIKSRQEIDLEVKKIDKELNTLKDQIVRLNLDILKSEHELNNIEKNITPEDVKKQLPDLQRQNLGIRGKIEVIKLSKKN